MSRRGGGRFQNIFSITVKYRPANIGIPASKGVFTSVNKILGKEPSWVNLTRSISVIQSVDRMHQLLQEAAMELTKYKELITGDPEYMAFVDVSWEGCIVV